MVKVVHIGLLPATENEMHTQEQGQGSQQTIPTTAWLLFPNGKMWKVEDGVASGTVLVEKYEGADDLEARLDMIAEAATGSIIGLSNFGYKYLGGGLVNFSGTVEGLSDEDDEVEDDEDKPVVVVPGSKQFIELLESQYGMLTVEAEHAADNLDNDYGEECVVQLANGREVRTAAYHEQASYVRVCIDGLEIAYWVNTEWHQVGEDVMGAFIAAMRGSLQMQ